MSKRPDRRTTGPAFNDETRPLVPQMQTPPLPVIIRAHNSASTPDAFRLAAGACLIGTSKGAHLILNDPTVSRQHCELELTAGGVVVSDLESTNGTLYLGKRVDRIVLPAGATFSVGAVSISIESDLERLHLEPVDQTSLGLLQGESLAMRQLFALILRMQSSTVPVLIEGETGTGKEACARTVHAFSPMSAGPFVPIRCGALPADLIAAELFGSNESPGAIVRAQEGTLFLDQIDALPSDLQGALLQAIESGELVWGAVRQQSTRFRLLSSTSVALEDMVVARTFEEGLFFRVGAIRLRLPPLRDRREDIGLLAWSIAKDFDVTLEPAVVEELRSRSWPGNVRELRSALQAFSALGVLPAPTHPRSKMLELALDEAIDLTRPYSTQKDEMIDRFTKRYLHALLARADGNQSVAARLADLDRTYLGKLLARYGFK